MRSCPADGANDALMMRSCPADGAHDALDLDTISDNVLCWSSVVSGGQKSSTSFRLLFEAR
jgi:hypothetical protein